MSSAFNSIDYDLHSGNEIKKLIEARLEELRVKLETHDMIERDTQQTRGAIRELRQLLRDKPPVVHATRYGNTSFTRG